MCAATAIAPSSTVAIPGAYDEALGEADLFFQVEIPAVAHWQFGPAEAERVTQPVLNLSGADTVPRFKDGADLVQSWFPRRRARQQCRTRGTS